MLCLEPWSTTPVTRQLDVTLLLSQANDPSTPNVVTAAPPMVDPAPCQANADDRSIGAQKVVLLQLWGYTPGSAPGSIVDIVPG